MNRISFTMPRQMVESFDRSARVIGVFKNFMKPVDFDRELWLGNKKVVCTLPQYSKIAFCLKGCLPTFDLQWLFNITEFDESELIVEEPVFMIDCGSPGPEDFMNYVKFRIPTHRYGYPSEILPALFDDFTPDEEMRPPYYIVCRSGMFAEFLCNAQAHEYFHGTNLHPVHYKGGKALTEALEADNKTRNIIQLNEIHRE